MKYSAILTRNLVILRLILSRISRVTSAEIPFVQVSYPRALPGRHLLSAGRKLRPHSPWDSGNEAEAASHASEAAVFRMAFGGGAFPFLPVKLGFLRLNSFDICILGGLFLVMLNFDSKPYFQNDPQAICALDGFPTWVISFFQVNIRCLT